MKKYKNGTTPEEIFADVNCTLKIGTLFPHAECECLGIYEDKAILKYGIYSEKGNIVNTKIGFARWLGGIQN